LVLIAEFNSIRKSGETDLKAIVLQELKFVYAQFNDCICCLIRIFTDGIKQRFWSRSTKPLATVVIGGLVATFLTLFVLPILYIMFEKEFN
jgi:cobalt-zinc-cadmium resistance protein CzcA